MVWRNVEGKGGTRERTVRREKETEFTRASGKKRGGFPLANNEEDRQKEEGELSPSGVRGRGGNNLGIK